MPFCALAQLFARMSSAKHRRAHAAFPAPDSAGRLVSLEQLLALGPVVISFNRGHWCPFCRIELTSLAEAHGDFAGLGAQVREGINTRSPEGLTPAEQLSRIAEAVETALDLGRGVIHLAFVDIDRDETTWKVDRYSQHLACDQCGKSYEES